MEIFYQEEYPKNENWDEEVPLVSNLVFLDLFSIYMYIFVVLYCDKH